MSETDLLNEALLLPPAARAGLVEKIVESLVADIDPAMERSHLEAIADRRSESGALVSADEVLRRARALLPE